MLFGEESDDAKLFIERWSRAWPSATFQFMKATAIREPRGLGICKSLLHIVDVCREYFSIGLLKDVCIMLEPDALPFIDGPQFEESVAMYLNNTPSDAELLLMGGHLIRHNCQDGLAAPWTRVRDSSGLYGIMIPQLAIEKARSFLTTYVATKRAAYSCDNDFVQHTVSYLATPLLVDHPAKSHSHTWNRIREDNWTGNRHWISFVPPHLQSTCGQQKLHELAKAIVTAPFR